MWVEFFVLGGVWFWLLTAVFTVALIWEISGDKGVAALFTLVLYLAIIHLFGNAALFATIAANSAWIYIGLPIYVVVGVVWSLGKFHLYTRRKFREDYKEIRMLWLHHNGMEDATLDTGVPEHLRKKFTNNHFKPKKILAMHNKEKITTWMAFWPLSMLWAVIDEPWRWIYDMLSELFQKISDHAYKNAGVDEDFYIPGPVPKPKGPMARLREQVETLEKQVDEEGAVLADKLNKEEPQW